MKDNQTTPLSVRINILTLAEINKEIQGTSKSLPDWFREAIEEKLMNENQERLDREIRIKKEELGYLKKKKENFVEKKNIIQKIPEKEISFFLDAKKVIDRDPNFIQGQISLYKNKFNKNHLRISAQEFLEMIENSFNQYQEKQILENNGIQ